MLRRIVLTTMALCLWTQVAWGSNDFGRDAGWGSLAALCNFLYMPAKLVYGAIGGVTGGLAYLVTVGNEDAAKGVWAPSLGGTYVLTPEMLRGVEPILFSGASYSRE
jgi:hypothetical protein